jgi:hypothetical protein
MTKQHEELTSGASLLHCSYLFILFIILSFPDDYDHLGLMAWPLTWIPTIITTDEEKGSPTDGNTNDCRRSTTGIRQLQGGGGRLNSGGGTGRQGGPKHFHLALVTEFLRTTHPLTKAGANDGCRHLRLVFFFLVSCFYLLSLTNRFLLSLWG